MSISKIYKAIKAITIYKKILHKIILPRGLTGFSSISANMGLNS
jgi:hypothetical protein